jgi:hypothetical protein
MSKVALITVLFDYPEYYRPTFYEKSLEFFNTEDIHIIRLSNLIKTESYYEKLYYYKIIKLFDYIKDNIVNNYDYVLFMDATDTAFIKSFDGVLEKFKKLNCSILFGAEKELWPPTNYVHLYDKKEKLSEYCYLNSGTYIGYTDKIFDYLKDMIDKDYHRDDQGSWSTIYLLNDDVKIDQKCEVFFSTHKSKNKIKYEDNKYSLINIDAHIIHDNGGYHEDTIKLVDFFK